MPTILVTAPPTAAETIARRVVEERLAGAVNRTSCDSVYRWEGEVVESEEALLLVQTTEECFDRCVDRVLDLHPYEVPRIERFDAADAHSSFQSWLTTATGDPLEDGDESVDGPARDDGEE